jgi:16S rRNA (cytosine1402-N4)-methyltransferase
VPELFHKPVLLKEVLEVMAVHPTGRYGDGTVGGAGHAQAILEASSPTGWLYGCDRDGAALQAAIRKLSSFAGRFELRQGNYSELAEWIEAGSLNGVLLDLGISSLQLGEAARGFSLVEQGPLDMRMDPTQGMTAADLVNTASDEELAKIFWEYGGEEKSRRIAKAIVHDRPFQTTRQLAELIERISPRYGRKTHPATQVFQALRIAVNDEIGSLKRGLAGAVKILRPGGRLAVITFHSSEDRVVKEFGRQLSRGYEVEGEVDVPELRKPVPPVLKVLTRKAIKPSEAEVRDNPRSRSAQLRAYEKI